MTRKEINTYNRKKYAENPEKILKRNRASYLRNKDSRNEGTRRWIEKHPWYYSYAGARARCKPNAKYGKRGIKFEMTIKDFEYLWYRDAADLLERPSIDRIENDKGYTVGNCRFIEFVHNCRKNKYPEILK